MTDRRSFDRDRWSFFRDREMIADLFWKKDRKKIAIFEDRDLAIARSLVKSRLKMIQYKTTKNFEI